MSDHAPEYDELTYEASGLPKTGNSPHGSGGDDDRTATTSPHSATLNASTPTGAKSARPPDN